MKTTLVQFAPRLNRSNLEYISSVIEKYSKESDIIVFPELALNGYLLQDKLYEDAFEIEELSVLETLSKDIDIVVGCAIKDNGVFRNTALYFSDGKLLSKHYKVHLPNYGMFEEARYFKAGDIFESFISKFGKVSMLVCEDLWHKSVHHDLIEENPDIIIALVASPARGFGDDGLEIQKKWYDIIKTVASECESKVIFVNRVGFEDGLGFWGGSCVLDEKAKILKQLPLHKTDIQTFNINI
ncbi:MAG: nitrilase-related carbon-nitrogen hydrolase [Campylobacterales bacterium]